MLGRWTSLSESVRRPPVCGHPQKGTSLRARSCARNCTHITRVLRPTAARGEPANVLGVKGVGEIGITGTAGAVANAIWHATGIRVRAFPITLDKLIV